MAHSCEFPEILIEESDEDEHLVAGMKVLVPCDCGEMPLDHLDFMTKRDEEMTAALLAVEPSRPLYHWSPTVRRKQIIRYGLRPAMPSVTSHEWRAPYVCFADSPSWAWALSGGLRRQPIAPWEREWDLWQTWQEALVEPQVLATPDRPSGIYEVRTEHRVFKRDLWLVGSRTKT